MQSFATWSEVAVSFATNEFAFAKERCLDERTVRGYDSNTPFQTPEQPLARVQYGNSVGRRSSIPWRSVPGELRCW